MSVINAKYFDATLGVWLPVSAPGPTGPLGPTGPVGPMAPISRIDPLVEEIVSGDTAPDLSVTPEAELWYDTATPPDALYEPFPPGGTLSQSLTQTPSGLDWKGPNLQLTGGDMTGPLTVNGDVAVNRNVSAPTVNGDVWFNNDISAPTVDNRDYEWEEWNAGLNLRPEWSQGDGVGPCKAWRTRYAVLLNMDIRQQSDASGGIFPPFTFHEWLDVFSNPLPVGWRPATMLWDTFHSVEYTWQGPIFQARLQPDGQLRIWAHGSWNWQRNTKIPIYFCFPRPPE